MLCVVVLMTLPPKREDFMLDAFKSHFWKNLPKIVGYKFIEQTILFILKTRVATSRLEEEILIRLKCAVVKISALLLFGEALFVPFKYNGYRP